MSGINNVGGSSTAKYLQQLAANAAAAGSSPLNSDSSQSDADQNDIGGGGNAIDFSSLRAQLEAAIQAALQGSTASDAGSALTKIKSAVDTTLQAAGIDPAQLKNALSSGGAAATGAAGAQAGQDLVSILDALDQSDASSSTLDGLLGTDSGDDTSGLSALLGGNSTGGGSTSVDAGGATTTDDLLSQLYAQLFQNFPNGSGLDASA